MGQFVGSEENREIAYDFRIFGVILGIIHTHIPKFDFLGELFHANGALFGVFTIFVWDRPKETFWGCHIIMDGYIQIESWFQKLA